MIVKKATTLGLKHGKLISEKLQEKAKAAKMEYETRTASPELLVLLKEVRVLKVFFCEELKF